MNKCGFALAKGTQHKKHRKIMIKVFTFMGKP
jgi:hypothetical protein